MRNENTYLYVYVCERERGGKKERKKERRMKKEKNLSQNNQQ